jgi:hypothetical protein
MEHSCTGVTDHPPWPSPRASWVWDAPEIVYQTILTDGGVQVRCLWGVPDSHPSPNPCWGVLQDSSSPLTLKAAFYDYDFDGATFSGSVRRFDGAEVSEFDEATGTMQGLRMPSAFKFSVSDSELTVEVSRPSTPTPITVEAGVHQYSGHPALRCTESTFPCPSLMETRPLSS